jgi:hypothetical protein
MPKIKKAQKGAITPTYKNLRMGVRNENYQMTGENRDIKPTSLDSANYRRGFIRGLQGGKEYPNERNVEKMGRWEGQNAAKTKKKMQAGGTTKSTGKAPDKKGDYITVQKRTLGNMEKGGKMAKAEGGKWIQKAIKRPGALRKQLGAKPGQPIPAGKLAAAAKKPGKIGQRARLAQTLKKMKKK